MDTSSDTLKVLHDDTLLSAETLALCMYTEMDINIEYGGSTLANCISSAACCNGGRPLDLNNICR